MPKPKGHATPSDWAEIRHFKPRDFSCKCGNCNGKSIPIDMNLVRKLDAIAEAVMSPVVVQFGIRCQTAQDRKARGPSNSPHVPHGENGLATAVDILCPSKEVRYQLIQAALFAEIDGIGIGPNFVHLEIDHREGRVCWLYPGR